MRPAGILAAMLMLLASMQLDPARADEDDSAQQLDPLTVTPRQDDLFYQSDRKLRNLVDDVPCMGCNVPKPEKGVVRQIGEYLLYQITPLEPQERDRDPAPGPSDLSPEEISKSAPDER